MDLRHSGASQLQHPGTRLPILESASHLVDLCLIQVLIHLIIILEQSPLFDRIGIFMHTTRQCVALSLLPDELHAVIGIQSISLTGVIGFRLPSIHLMFVNQFSYSLASVLSFII